MVTVKIITPPGMFGVGDPDDALETLMRMIGIAFGDADEWPEKYGTDVENEVFLMKRFCWCERDDCLWCGPGDAEDFDLRLAARFGTTDYQEFRDRHYWDPPNFWYKPTNFRLSWYKYIGRDMASNTDSLPVDAIERIFATHPDNMTAEQAYENLITAQRESSQAFKVMLGSLNES